MKRPRLVLTAGCVAALAFLLQPAHSAAAAAGASRGTVLIDFSDNRRAPDGRAEHPYEYTYQDWGDGHVIDLPGRGVLVKAPSGRGGIGENRTSVPFDGSPAAELVYLIGNANHATSLTFALTDRDGTEVQWSVPLRDRASGQLLRHRIDLTKPDNVLKPGKTAGLDRKRVREWQLRGDATAPNVEVLLVRLVETE